MNVRFISCCLFGMCFALFSVSSLASQSVDVVKRSGYYDLKSTSVNSPTELVFRPVNSEPSFYKHSDGLAQDVSATVSTSFGYLPSLTIPTSGYLYLSRPALAQAAIDKALSYSSLALSIGLDFIAPIASANDWNIDSLGSVVIGDPSGEHEFVWSPDSVKYVSTAEANSILQGSDNVERATYVRRHLWAVPTSGGVRPPPPPDFPSRGEVVACPSELSKPSDMVSCYVVAVSDQRNTNSRWYYYALFAASHIDQNAGPTLSPWWVGTDVNPDNNTGPSSYTVVYAPEVREEQGSAVPLTVDEFTSTVLAEYEPSPNDIKDIFDYIPANQPESLTIRTISAQSFPPKITTTTDNTDGTTTVTEVNASLDVHVNDNSTHRPSLEADLHSNERQYINGDLIYDNSTNNIYTPGPGSGSGSGSGSGPGPGSGSIGGSPYELPVFCEWSPTVCDFIDWFQHEPDLTEEPPELPVDEILLESADYQIDGGAASCPDPYQLTLSTYGTYPVSYQLFCDLAVSAKPLYLTLMAVFASLLIYRSMV